MPESLKWHQFFIYVTWIPEIRNESFDRVSPIIYFQEQPTAV